MVMLCRTFHIPHVNLAVIRVKSCYSELIFVMVTNVSTRNEN